MILRSITIQGWRCFANRLSLGPFTERLNVIHGPNGTGKSTVFEALLRGLLDAHRVSGQEVQALRPWGRDLAPSVKVEFAHGKVEYRVSKQFLDRPSAELERREDDRFVRVAEGDAADERVREILTRNPPGRGLARTENWGVAQVLWAKQGELALPKLSGDLVADIRNALGAQISGPGGEPLERKIEAAYLRVYTAGGQVKKGKDAPVSVRLRNDLNAAREAAAAARVQHEQFEETARRVEHQRALRLQTRRDAEALAKALDDARERAGTYRALVAETEQRAARANAAEAQHGQLKQHIEAIGTAQSDLATARTECEKLESDLPLRNREIDERGKEVERTRMALENVRAKRAAVEADEQRAVQAQRYLDETRHASEIDARLGRIDEASKELARCREARARRIAPDAKAMRAIRKAVKERDDAQVRLEAALITVEITAEKPGRALVISGETTGEVPLPAGVPAQVRGSPEVVFDLPGVARVRARGPSGAIDEIRVERDKAARRVAALTEMFGTADIETLHSLQESAEGLDRKVAAAQASLEALLGGETVESIQADRAAINSRVSQILENNPGWRDAPPDAEALRIDAETRKRQLRADIDAGEAQWQGAQSALAAVAQQRAVLLTLLDETKRRVKALAARHAELTADGRQEAGRLGELRRLALAWEAAQCGLDEARRKLGELGDDPAAEVARLERQLAAADEHNRLAVEREKVEEGRLAQLSVQGPYTALVGAEEEAARLEREIREDELRLDAIRLLHDTVRQIRSDTLAAIARPVEQAATRTLRRIAGLPPGQVRLNDAFEPAHVAVSGAGGEPVAVEQMSGGEREQLYLATRLALAEILARDERQLVVLDDVLVATDIGRFARVLGILEEAAQCLQVLVLTCHPERYWSLEGACMFDLDRIARDGVG